LVQHTYIVCQQKTAYSESLMCSRTLYLCAGLLSMLISMTIGCVEPAWFTRGDQYCPSRSVCVNQTCVGKEEVLACQNLQDGDGCRLPTAAGVCRSGVCSVLICGDGIVQSGEVCDDGNFAPGDGCGTRCDSDETCGNGVLDSAVGEACDCGRDGATLANGCNVINGDGDTALCRSDCQLRCGDGIASGSLEQCDGQDLAGLSCESLGRYGGTLACSPFCRADISSCSADRCGDGVINGDELCDGAALEIGCLAVGFDYGRAACSSSCTPSFGECGTLGWKKQALPESSFAWTVWRSPSGKTYVGARGGVYVSADGVQWTYLAGGQSLPADISGTSDADVYSVNANQATQSVEVWRWNGSAWMQMLSTPGLSYYPRLWVQSSSNIYVTQQRTFVLHYDGVAWAQLELRGPQGEVVTWNSVWGSAANDVWAVGSMGMVAHYDGLQWTSLRLPAVADQYLAAIDGISSNHFVVSGTQGALVEFRNGVFAKVITDVKSDIRAVSMAADGRIFAAATDGTLIQVRQGVGYDDSTYQGSVIHDVNAKGSSTPIAVGGAQLMLTYQDSGWMSAWLPGGDRLNSVVQVDQTLFALGSTTVDGYIATLKSDVAVTHVTFGISAAVGFGSGSLVAVAPSALAPNWTANAYRFDGTSWVHSKIGDFYPFSVWGANSNDVWASGINGLSHFDGTTWTAVAPVLVVGYGLWGTGSNSVYMVGHGLAHFDGATWSKVSVPTMAFLKAVKGVNDSDIYAVGKSGTVIHFDGTQWTLEPTPTTATLRAVEILPNGDVYAFGKGGTAIRKRAGQWTAIRAPRIDFRGATWLGGREFALVGMPTSTGSRLYRFTAPLD
jgi:cysteine-rich repeat protein